MTQYTLILTETPKGINDHARHLGRRAIAKARAKSLGYLVNVNDHTPGAHGKAGVFTMVVDDQGDGSLNPQQDLKPIFEYYGYVTVNVA
jgi:hypothetical protein